MEQATVNLLKRLTEASGVTGYEQEVADIISQELKGLGTLSHDKMGCVICTKRGTSDQPKIMLPGHMDEVGFMVKLITNEGFIRFTMLGSWIHQYLPAQTVVIKTSKSRRSGTPIPTLAVRNADRSVGAEASGH